MRTLLRLTRAADSPIGQHKEPCSVFQGSLGRMDTCPCVAESLRSSPEIITALQIGYTPIQNKKVLKINKMNNQVPTV